MSIKRLILSLLTFLLVVIFGLRLLDSWRQPQIQSRLELYQTNLLLHAAEWQEKTEKDSGVKSAREALIGREPLEAAQKQYQQTRKSVLANLEKATKQLELLKSNVPVPAPANIKPPQEIDLSAETYRSAQVGQLQDSINELEKLIKELDVKIGILQAKQGQIDRALQTWQSVSQENTRSTVKTADILIGLWSKPARILPNAQQVIQNSLDGWFRYQGLTQLYQLQQREEALAKLQAREAEIAEQAVFKLAFVGGLPTFGFLIGVGLLIFTIVQWLLKKDLSLLSQNSNLPWATPWDAETVWQVFIVGFFAMQLLVSIFLLPVLVSLLNLDPASFDLRTKAFSVFATYAIVAVGGILVLYFSIKSFLPLPSEWFRFDLGGNWFWWGLGGYFTALPLVIVVSLINQKIWQGQGGSNPLLSLALQANDRVALGIFFVTAAIAAPLFEEFLFRGFLLPSLTRYMPVWGAILLSSFFFALAHLSLSEVLPLTTLGVVLGIVYTRSRNLLAPMFLHGLWNSGTLLSLFILGSGAN